jgi:hypothetical protein
MVILNKTSLRSSLSDGIWHKPGELHHSKAENAMVEELWSSPWWICMAGFQSGESIGMDVAANAMVTHRFQLLLPDVGNLPSIPCSITPGGDFDPDKGNFIVLYDLKLIICFPAGSNISFCLGGVAHGNLPIQAGESRSSFSSSSSPPQAVIRSFLTPRTYIPHV